MATATTDFYGILGVPREASEADIKRAYRSLARQYHPDVNKDDPESEAKFKAVNEAHDVLSNGKSRRDYDEFGDDWRHADQLRASGAQFGGGSSGARGRAGSGDGFRVFTFAGDDGSAFSFADLFGHGGGFGSGFGPASEPQVAQSVEMQVTLEEAFRGSERVIEIRQPQGDTRAIAVKIPAGIADGGKIKVRPDGMPPIDATVRVAAHPVFERRGDDLRCDFEVPLDLPVLGGHARVRTLDGVVELDIPAGTPNGKAFKLAGKGMPGMRGAGRGNLIATLKVVLPRHVDAEQRQLFEKMRDARTRTGNARPSAA